MHLPRKMRRKVRAFTGMTVQGNAEQASMEYGQARSVYEMRREGDDWRASPDVNDKCVRTESIETGNRW